MVRLGLTGLLAVVFLWSGLGMALAQQEDPNAPEGSSPVQLAASPYRLAGDLASSGAYIVRLSDPPLASYQGGLSGLEATNPSARGERQLDAYNDASIAYRDYLAQQRNAVLAEVESLLDRQLDVIYEYDVVLNGFAARMTPIEAGRVAGIPGVVSVRPDQWRYALTDVTPDFIGASSIWDGSASNGVATKGEGVIVGIIDSGIWPEHPSFADDGSYPAPPAGWSGTCQPPDDGTAGYTCTNKLIGIQHFLSSYISASGGVYDGLFNSGRDDNGHGTHTAGTAAGNENVAVTLLGVSRGPVSGIAPRAHVASYKALGPQGGTSADLVAAIDQAVADGVDVINYSIGGASSDPWQDDDAQAFLAAREAGVFVATSAGNSGPGPATLGSPGDAPWITTVGASTSNRHFLSDITLSGPGTPPTGLYGASVTAGVTNAVLIDAEGIADSQGDSTGLCLNPYSPGTFDGYGSTVVVLCKRGQISRVARGDHVQAGGGEGVILYNPTPQGLATDNFVIPAVHVESDTGLAIKDYLGLHSPGAVIVSFTSGTAVYDSDPRVTSDMMASFSSRGPSKPAVDVIKPNVTAPGVQILAGASPEHVEPGAQGELWQSIQGTSMSSPHVAGAGALVKAVQPSWTAQEIESALMTTANPVHVKEDGVSPTDPFDLGTGRIDLTRATRAGLLLDETQANFEAADPALGGDPSTLNLAGLGDGSCYQSCSWTRTVRNPTATSMTWNGVFEGLDGLEATLSPTSLTLAGGASTSYSLSVDDATALQTGQWYYGTVTWTESSDLAPEARFPVAVRVVGTSDPRMIVKMASPSGTGTGGTVEFAIEIFNAEPSARSFSVSDPVPASSSYVSGSATGGLAYSAGSNSLSWSGSMPAASFTIEERSLSGYQSMAALGVPPLDLGAIDLDSQCFTIGGMDYYYFGTNYDVATISMNGVMRAGTPVLFCPPDTNQNLPQPDTLFGDYDNLIAPWWADLDLNPSGGITPAIYAVLLSHNGAPHTVFEWENARVKSTGAFVTFQIWIEEGTDNIWFAYPPGFNPGSASPMATVGAENDDGSDGGTYYYNGSGTVPNGSTDVWVGLQPSSRVFTFDVTATGSSGSDILNEAQVTVSAATNTAWANAHICGSAVPVTVTPDARNGYVVLDWSAGASAHDTYQVWRSTLPYVAPGAAGSTMLYEGKRFSYIDEDSGMTVGDAATNHYYVVKTVNCAGTGTAASNGVAEFDYSLAPGQP